MHIVNNIPFPEKTIATLKKNGIIHKYTCGEFLSISNDIVDHTCFLLSGYIKLYIKNNHKQTVLCSLQTNTICTISHMIFFKSYEIQFLTEFREDSYTLLVPYKIIQELCHTDAEFKKFMMTCYQFHYNSLLNLIDQFLQSSLKDRLYSYLESKSLFLDSTELKIPIQEIADDLNYSREAISRGLKELEENYKIVRKTKTIQLLFKKTRFT